MSKKVKVHCDYCFKEFERYKSERWYKGIYCSLPCYYEYRKVSGTKECAKVLKTLDEDFLNWFSGFWEGEGCVQITGVKEGRPTPRFTLYQSDLPVMEYIQNKFKNVAAIVPQTKNGKLSKRDGYIFQTGKFGECVLFAYILKNRIKSEYKNNN